MTARGGRFVDEQGRVLLIHGANVGGSSKVPARPEGTNRRYADFPDHRAVSFVGRPFRVEEAREHFGRLRRWGFTLLRLLVTWEAVEHSGPGIIDQEYLDYLVDIVTLAGEYELQIVVDLHQDVWSRFCGGDGAPGWTLELAGMDLRRLIETGAAIIHPTHRDRREKMIWSTNGLKLAAATMFTLFFGGNEFAPGLTVDGSSIQDFLRERYAGVLRAVATRLRDHPNVIGYDPMNEPLPGYIGCTDLEQPGGEPRIGAMPSPLQAMALGAGVTQEIGVWRFGSTGSHRIGRRAVNVGKVPVWRAGYDCVWREHGVWVADANGQPRVLRPDYFHTVRSGQVDFDRDYLLPFFEQCAAVIRSVHPGAHLFLEPAIGSDHLVPWGGDPSKLVAAPHWYDGTVIMLKRFNPFIGADSLSHRLVIGRRAVRRSYRRQLETLARRGIEGLQGAPTLIGETGIPFDLGGGASHPERQDRLRSRAMERTLRAMDDALLSYAIWNYTADNTRDQGDQWNDEDFSIFNVESGGRALSSVVRPYARAIAGNPVRMEFNRRRRRFEFVFDHDPTIESPTELFVPDLQYHDGFTVELSDGHYERDPDRQLLRYYHTSTRQRHWIRIRP